MTAPTAAPDIVIRAYRLGDEAAILDLIREAAPGSQPTLDEWRAKHAERPGFDPEDIYLAEHAGRIVGCLHTAIFPIRVAPDITLLVSMDSGLFIAPHARERGIAESLYAACSQRLYHRGVHLRCGYVLDPIRAEYFRRRLGYIVPPGGVRIYKKFLDLSVLTERLLRRLGSSSGAGDPGNGPLVEFAVAGMPSILLRLSADRVAVAAHGAGRPVLRVRVDQRVLGTLAEGHFGFRVMLRFWRQGALRSTGWLLGGLPVGIWLLFRGLRIVRRAQRSPRMRSGHPEKPPRHPGLRLRR